MHSLRTRYAPVVLIKVLLALCSQSAATQRVHPSFFDDFDPLQEERDKGLFKDVPEHSRGSRDLQGQTGSSESISQALDVALLARYVGV